MARLMPVVTLVLVLVLLVTGGSPARSPPQTCRSTFDAVARIRGELFFFNGDHFWRVSRAGHLMTRDPVEVDTFWEGLPHHSDVSAAYERPDGSVVFFCGRHFWVFWERRTKPGYPRPLSDLGLPEELSSVDAAFVNRHTEVTYLITGDKYWRFNERTEQVDSDSPQPLHRLCRGLPKRVDAAFSDTKGHTYFLQGQHYWRCDLGQGRVQNYAPHLVAPRWLGCTLAECCLDDHIETEVWPKTYEYKEKLSEEGRRNARENAAARGGVGSQVAVVVLAAAAVMWRGL
ncbi:Matrix metalloproteinase-25 [Amphibalanus amphitrite]|uniref:Matrix metalloproteinase-25 n=1 Tax=Amphibalanus amphitrite TaxID=1232801 RepID=A0A6A4VL84_AMPAM|nr:Matrix metalloproteinase-25 [Amphibalanus amphitrite]